MYLYLSALLLFAYRRRRPLIDAFQRRDIWEGCRRTMAVLWSGHGWIWHGNSWFKCITLFEAEHPDVIPGALPENFEVRGRVFEPMWPPQILIVVVHQLFSINDDDAGCCSRTTSVASIQVNWLWQTDLEQTDLNPRVSSQWFLHKVRVWARCFWGSKIFLWLSFSANRRQSVCSRSVVLDPVASQIICS